MLAHLGGAGGAVEADHVDAERLEGRERRADLGAEQHGAGGLDGDRADQGGWRRWRQGAAGAEDRGLGLQQVLGGLHQEGVRATGDHAFGIGLVGVAEGDIGRVAEGGQLGAGAHGAQHPALASVGGELVGDLTGDPGVGLGELVDAFGDVVLTERRVVGTEGVGLDAVHPGGVVLLVDRADDVRAGDVEDLVAALELLEVVETGVLRLEHRPHRTVGDHHAGGQCFAERVGSGGGCGRWRMRGHGCAPWSATAVGFAPSLGTAHHARVAASGHFTMVVPSAGMGAGGRPSAGP